MDKETKKEFETLARMVADGFGHTDKKIDGVDKKVDAVDRKVDDLAKKSGLRFMELESKMDEGFKNVDSRLLVIERDIAEIRSHFVYRNEFEDLAIRVKYLETKLGLESGK